MIIPLLKVAVKEFQYHLVLVEIAFQQKEIQLAEKVYAILFLKNFFFNHCNEQVSGSFFSVNVSI